MCPRAAPAPCPRHSPVAALQKASPCLLSRQKVSRTTLALGTRLPVQNVSLQYSHHNHCSSPTPRALSLSARSPCASPACHSLPKPQCLGYHQTQRQLPTDGTSHLSAYSLTNLYTQLGQNR